MEERMEQDSCPFYPSLAIAYVPDQVWRRLYDTETGFHKGTIFEELDKPFLGREASFGHDKA
ncbi:MAG: spore coat associated protein CotJA [Massiliimalia sp.]